MEYLSFHSDWLFLFVAFEPMGGKVAVFGIIFYLMAGIWKEKTLVPFENTPENAREILAHTVQKFLSATQTVLQG